jgi:hypothetical protein
MIFNPPGFAGNTYHSLTLICEQVVSSSLFGPYSPCEALDSPLQAGLESPIRITFPDLVLLVSDPDPMSRLCIRFVQFSGSMMFWFVSIPGSCTFFNDLQDGNKKYVIFFSKTSYFLLRLHLQKLQRKHVSKKSQNCRNQGFSSFFCSLIEGSVPNTTDPDPEGPKT